jgi:hypothetical protein
LDRRRRRRLALRTALRASLSVVGLIALYYVLPMERGLSASTVLLLLVGLGIVLGLFVYQLRAVVESQYPGLRGIEAVAIIAPLFLIIFASTYFLMARDDADNFSEALSRTDALYFTITVFSTVGFGDITPRTDSARIIVATQMILDLGILGLGIRVFLDAVKLGQQRRSTEREGNGG